MENYNLTIMSKQNPRVKYVRALHTKKGRKQFGQYIAQGKKVIQTLIEAGNWPIELFCLDVQTAHQFGVECKIRIVSESVMRYISTETTPSGMIAVFEIPQDSPTDIVAPGLILVRISDPGNMGAIIRCAVAMGCKQLFAIECTDVWAPKVVQASAGYSTSISIVTGNWHDVVTRAKQQGIPLAALVVRDGQPLHSIELSKALLVVGSEAHGIPQEWLADCDYTITLAMPGNTESINVVSAASIAMYCAFIR